MAQRPQGKGGMMGVPRRSGGRPKAAPKKLPPIFGPNFNKPPGFSTKPKPVPKPKPQPTGKPGPYTKPVPYQPGKKYAPNTPVNKVPGEPPNRAILTPSPKPPKPPAPEPRATQKTPVSKKGKIPQGRVVAYGQNHPQQIAPGELKSIQQANKEHFNFPRFVYDATIGANIVQPAEAVGQLAQGNFSPGNILTAASIIPGFKLGRIGKAVEGADLGLHAAATRTAAESIAKDMAAGRSSEEAVANARKAVQQSLNSGKNKSRVIFKQGSAEPMESVAEPVIGPKSRSGILPHLQTGVDKYTQRAIDRGSYGNIIAKKNVANLVKRRQAFIDQRERALPAALKANKLTDAHRLALQLAAENTPPDVAAKFYDQAIREAKSARVVGDLKKQQALLPEAAKSLIVKEGKVVPHGNAPRAMHTIWGWMQESNRARVQQATKLGILKPETEARRLSAPGRVMRGARYQEKQIIPAQKIVHQEKVYEPELRMELIANRASPRQADAMIAVARESSSHAEAFQRTSQYAPNVRSAKIAADAFFGKTTRTVEHIPQQEIPGGLKGAEDFTGGQVYIPSKQNERLTGLGRARVSEVVTNRFRKPVGMTGEYKGTNLLTGRQDINAPKLVGEAGLSMQQFFHRTEGLQHLQEIGQTVDKLPMDLRHSVAVKMGDFSHQEKVDLNNALAAVRAEKTPTRQGLRAANKAFKGLLDKYLPEDPASVLNHEDAQYRFVWAPLAGERAFYSPAGALEHNLLIVPSNALKTLIVYTKLPGHIPARRLSNAFFNLAQMGFRLPFIARKQLLLNRQFPEWAHYMQTLTGEGSMEAIASSDIQKTLSNFVRRWSDANPRRMSVYYELERAAGRPLSPEEAVAFLRQMREAPAGSKLATEFTNVVQRATVHAGDYSSLTPIEKRLLSKVFFLWAWHRTAAVTTGKFALEHPLSAAGAGAGIYYLNNRVNAGQEPWNKFNVPVPGGKVANITTSFPLSQPVMDVKALANIGKPVFAENLGGELNPELTMAGETLFGRNLQTGTAAKSRWQAVPDVAKSMPPVALATGKGKLQDRINKFVFGTEFPQTAPATPQSALDSSISKLLAEKRITPQEAAQVKAQIAQYRKQLPGLERQVKAAFDKALGTKGISSAEKDALKKKEHRLLTSLQNKEKDIANRLKKAGQ